MTTPSRRVVIVGATGVFGARLSRRLAPWPDIILVLAARRRPDLEALRDDLARVAANPIEIALIDRDAPGGLADHRPWAVVDCAGPFQASDYRLVIAALAAGAHYLDLADARAFVAGFAPAMDLLARGAGRCALTGASSSPALGHAVLDEITRGWQAIDKIEVAIAPGARAPRGLSVVRAALSWSGRPVKVFTRGGWRIRPGWGQLRRTYMRGVGMRWLSLAETADLDLLPQRFETRVEGVFLAGLELSVEHLGLWALSLPVRAGWTGFLEPLAGALVSISSRLTAFGSDRGGMSVAAQGVGPDGRAIHARWSLCAQAGCGPNVPTLAAAAMLRAWLDGPPAMAGARACVGEATLEAIVAQASDLPIRTFVEFSAPEDGSLGRRLMGGRFDALPASVRQVHHGREPARFVGRAQARGDGGLAGLARAWAGMPSPGPHADLEVEIMPTEQGELWVRRFGARRFRSRLRGDPRNISRFEESIRPLTFVFEADPGASGFRWRFVGWKIGPLPLPRALAPRIRARCFDRDGVYHFSVAVAHPWIGLILAYAGRLEPSRARPETPLKGNL